MKKQSPQDLMRMYQGLKRRKTPTFLAIVIVAVAALTGSFFGTGGGSGGSGAAGGECAVTKVYDGDTMTLQCSGQAEPVKVRMYCIDTPEMKQTPWGQESRDHLQSIAGKRVTLVEHDKDRYGRIVAEVFTTDGTNLNLAQVAAGKAAVYAAYCKKPEYSQVQDKAKAAKLGIWAKAGMQQTPWDWRKESKN